jgi:hypothetical protein
MQDIYYPVRGPSFGSRSARDGEAARSPITQVVPIVANHSGSEGEAHARHRGDRDTSVNHLTQALEKARYDPSPKPQQMIKVYPTTYPPLCGTLSARAGWSAASDSFPLAILPPSSIDETADD